jgi:hypothetical protein
MVTNTNKVKEQNDFLLAQRSLNFNYVLHCVFCSVVYNFSSNIQQNTQDLCYGNFMWVGLHPVNSAPAGR